MSAKEFLDYCWSFYGKNEIYGDAFGQSLTRQELSAATALYRATAGDDFCGDSMDRECVRELLLFARDKKSLTRRALSLNAAV
ncbi:MAG: hypothetical protein EOO40_00405 [Deltaproteobacteria bacterium]|nr:MAG: hypothetical protein EOO40_00405 [Deltaproteobacteria bacterium]